MNIQTSQEHLDTLSEIRSLMERSSRFISLSGLSGVSAGIFALLGAALTFLYAGKIPFDGKVMIPGYNIPVTNWGIEYRTFFVATGAIVLLGAIGTAIFFTTRKAKRKGQKIWDPLTQRLLINLAIPLAVGGIFCLALIQHKYYNFAAPATIVFYGLGLINASKYTLPDIRYLGLSEVLLGLIGLFFIGYALEIWAIGFGVLHIVYGIYMYGKYEITR